MIVQLNPPIPVITPKGKALAHAIIDYGIEHDMQWLCFQDSTGECWTWANPQVRAQINITHGRDYISPFYDPNEVAFKREEEDEEIQGEESDEECEEGSEEEDFDWEAAHDLVEEQNCNLRKTLKESDEKLEELEDTKKALFELQDLIIKLIQIKKIDKTETKTVIDALKSTGVSQGDIEVRCHAKIR